MPWGWSIRNEPLATGGALGTPAEAQQTNAWPDYEANYLKHRLKDAKVGRGGQSEGWCAEVLTACDRSQAGPTAPPQGLFLVSVDYETGLNSDTVSGDC